MTTMDPHDRIEMTGPWAGFGFQGATCSPLKATAFNRAT